MSIRIVCRPDPPHRCDLPRDLEWISDNVGIVAVCDECGTGWVTHDGDYGIRWDLIGPWPFDRKARRALRDYYAKEGRR